MKPFLTLCSMIAVALMISAGGIAHAVTVNGTVQAVDGNSVGGIEVSLFRSAGVDDSWSLFAWRMTSADGSWSMNDVPAGRYRLKVFDWSQRYAYEFYDNVSFFDDATDIEIATDDLTIDVVIEPGGTITGTVATPLGAPLENPAVVIFDAEGELLYYETVFGTSYEIGGLATGSYLLRFTGAQFGSDGQWSYFQEWFDDALAQDLATPVEVNAGTSTPGIDSVMGFDEGGSISGVVKDLYGRPFISARVEAWQLVDSSWVMIRGVDTGDYYFNGEYTLDLPPGTYRLRFEASTDYNLANSIIEWWPDAETREDASDVVLELGDELTIDGVLGELAPGSISGTVSTGGGAPLPGIEVSIQGFAGELYRHFTRTANDGSFLIEGLQPDSYLLGFFDPEHEYRWAYLGGTQNPGVAERVVVSVSAVTGVDQAMVPGADLGSVSGFVTDPVGNPAAGVRVSAVDAADPLTFHTWATVRGDGSYRLRDVPGGSSLIQFDEPDGLFVEEWYDNAESEVDATPVDVAFDTAVTGIDAVLDTAGGIAGEVVNAFGLPFSLTTANAYSFDGSEWTYVAGAFAFEESNYLIAGLTPGTYRVVFSGGGWWGPAEVEWYDDAQSIETATDIEVVVGEITSGIDAVIGSGPPGAISGRVTGGDGLPVAGVEVRLYDENLTLRDTGAVTDDDGAYSIGLLYSGLYFVEFFDPNGRPGEFYENAGSLATATPLIIGAGTISGVDAVLDGAGSGPGGGAISGFVTEESTGLGVGGIRVSCFAEDLLDQPPCLSTTDADGSYTLGGNLPAGSYRVRFSDPAGAYVAEYFDDADSPVDATPVSVSLGTVSSAVDAAMTGAGALAGTVTDGAGNPLSKLLVSAFRQIDEEWRQVASTMTFYESDYTLAGLEPGTYRVRFADGYEGFFNESEFYNDANTINSADDIIIEAGVITDDINAVLRENLPGGIAGLVTDTLGLPVEGIEITVFDSTGSVVIEAISDSNGEYEVRNLLPGWYSVGFGDPADPASDEFFANVASLDLATPVEVSYAIVSGIDATLDGPGSGQGGAAVEGRVIDERTGLPIPLIEVQCFETTGFAIPRCRDLTDQDGRYRLGGFLPANPVVVRYEAPTWDFFAEWFDDAESFVAASSVALELGSTVGNVNAGLTPGEALRNTSFDVGIEAWIVDAPQGAVAMHSPIDAHGDQDSGSAWISADGAPEAIVALEQCMAAINTESLMIGGRVRIESIGDPTAAVTVTPFTDEECSSRSSGSSERKTVIEGPTSTLWRDVVATFDIGAGTGSVLLRFELHAGGANTLEAYWDALYAVPGEGSHLFADGFESGGLSAWVQR